MLEHGAEIYAGYLGDKDLVEEIELKRLARDFFTLKFTRDALRHIYDERWLKIYHDFAKMLIFDAIIGNNDRHFYNWGVVKNIQNPQKVKFSPIYDTARALFWNVDEAEIERWAANPNLMNRKIESYVNQSKPKVGLEGRQVVNHFDIIRELYSDYENGTKELVELMIQDHNKKRCIELIRIDFKKIVSPSRLKVIEHCINLRFEKIQHAIDN